MKKFIAVVSVIIIVCCIFYRNRNQQQKAKHKPPTYVYVNERVYSYGNGVYYFSVNEFGHTLSEFISKNDSLRLQSVAGDGASMGAHIGYFVIFEKK